MPPALELLCLRWSSSEAQCSFPCQRSLARPALKKKIMVTLRPRILAQVIKDYGNFINTYSEQKCISSFSSTSRAKDWLIIPWIGDSAVYVWRPCTPLFCLCVRYWWRSTGSAWQWHICSDRSQFCSSYLWMQLVHSETSECYHC